MTTTPFQEFQEASQVDMEHAVQRNTARSLIWPAAMGTVLGFGLFLFFSLLPVIEPASGDARNHRVIALGLTFLGVSSIMAGFTAKHFMNMKDYELTIQKGIWGELMKQNQKTDHI